MPVDHIGPPFDDSFPEAALPEALVYALFGDVDAEIPNNSLSTFAVLDAAVNPFVPDVLGATDLPHRSLYSGEAETEFSDSAPWLVQLDCEDKFLRSLLTKGEASWNLWANGLGVILRSTATFEEMRAHLRHFIKTKDANDKWYFFRFWEPVTSAGFFENLSENEQNYARWSRIAKDKAMTSVFVPMENSGLREIPFEQVKAAQPVGGFVLRDTDIGRMSRAKRMHADLALAALAVRPGDLFCEPTDQAKPAALTFAQNVRAEVEAFGVTSTTDQERIIRLSRLYGLGFYSDPRVPKPTAVSTPTQRMYAILDQRRMFADMLQGQQGSGGLDPSFLQSRGHQSDFEAALRCKMRSDNANAFYQRVDGLTLALERPLKIWLGFYLGHRFTEDARYERLLHIAQQDPAFDPNLVARWVCESIDNEPLGRPQ